jgi:hypothetical protein
VSQFVEGALLHDIAIAGGDTGIFQLNITALEMSNVLRGAFLRSRTCETVINWFQIKSDADFSAFAPVSFNPHVP